MYQWSIRPALLPGHLFVGCSNLNSFLLIIRKADEAWIFGGNGGGGKPVSQRAEVDNRGLMSRRFSVRDVWPATRTFLEK
jgi:hypothetical protein